MEVILISASENKDILQGVLIQQRKVKNNSLMHKEIWLFLQFLALIFSFIRYKV